MLNKKTGVIGIIFLLIIISIGSIKYMSDISEWLFDVTGKSGIPILDDSGYSSDGVQRTVEASNDFAFKLYKRYSEEKENIFYSSYSISTALSMTYEGAESDTANEMQSVFQFLDNNPERRSANARIFNLLNDGERDYTLHIVNALWLQQDYPIIEEYIETVEKYYGGEANSLDFVEEPEESRTIINEWVEDRTNDKIKDFFPSGTINPLTRLVLTNAIYFKGEWITEFDAKKTSKADFYLSSNETVEVDMMQIERASFNYTETENLQILELTYKGGDVSMVILLPKDKSIQEIEENLSGQNYYEWIKELDKTKINIYLPKFKFETKYFMEKDLSDMGMPLAFTEYADFTGMAQDKLFISNVIHQAFIEVDEKGTEAAAATGVSMELSAVPQIKEFKADHPFIFTLQDRDTGLILFIGKVLNPVTL